MKITTCALVIIDKQGNILGCHGTGKPRENGYDFPKGCAEQGENHLDAAVRELREETGIVLSKSEPIIDAGIHSHNRKKDIHIFIYRINHFPNINDLNCTSYFIDKNGKEIPEMDSYKIISKDERKSLFYHGLQNKFELIDQINEKF